MENIDKAIGLSQKRTELLLEMKEVLKYEACKYHLCEVPGMRVYKTDPGYFILYEISSKREVCSGRLKEIQSWIKIRNIDSKLIYNYPQMS